MRAADPGAPAGAARGGPRRRARTADDPDQDLRPLPRGGRAPRRRLRGADFLGFVLAESPRRADPPASPAGCPRSGWSSRARVVGVFVRPSAAEVAERSNARARPCAGARHGAGRCAASARPLILAVGPEALDVRRCPDMGGPGRPVRAVGRRWDRRYVDWAAVAAAPSARGAACGRALGPRELQRGGRSTGQPALATTLGSVAGGPR